jgi:staphylococcal nuclease domain-containing protein 1
VRGPRAGGRDRAPEPYGLEAREFLRKKLIGKEVTVKMEYTRKIGFQPGQEQAPAVPGQEVSLGPAVVLDTP